VLRGLRWLNAALLVLAACRALVPGLCATQRASNEAAAERAVHACCVALPAQDDGCPAYRAARASLAECGLCALMHGMLDPVESATIPTPTLAKLRRLDYRIPNPALQPMRAHNGRAPPQPLAVFV
jgi:hypothetical protein